MQKVPESHRYIIDGEQWYFGHCIFCHEPSEIDHVFIFSGRQIVEVWNYVPICVNHHRIGPMAKQNNAMIRNIVEYHCLANEKMKNEWCVKYGVSFEPVEQYDKAGMFKQREKFLFSMVEGMMRFLEKNGMSTNVLT